MLSLMGACAWPQVPDAVPDELDEAEQGGRSRRFLHFSSARSRPDRLTYSSEASDGSEQQQAARKPRVVDMSRAAAGREQDSGVAGSSPSLPAEDEGEGHMADDFQDQDAEDEGDEDEEAEPYLMADDYGEDSDPEYDPGESAEAREEPGLAIKSFRRSDGWTVLNASLEDGIPVQPVQHAEARGRPQGLRSVEDVILRKADMRSVKESGVPAERQPDAELLEAASSAVAEASAISAADNSEAAPHRQQEARHKGVLMTSSSHVFEIVSK